MANYLDAPQLRILQEVLLTNLCDNVSEKEVISNSQYVTLFLDAKSVEGCSKRTIVYYGATIENMITEIQKPIRKITTEDLREFLAKYQRRNNCSKVTVISFIKEVRI